MAGAISFSGLGSGMNTKGIVDALVNVEKAPINALKQHHHQSGSSSSSRCITGLGFGSGVPGVSPPQTSCCSQGSDV